MQQSEGGGGPLSKGVKLQPIEHKMEDGNNKGNGKKKKKKGLKSKCCKVWLTDWPLQLFYIKFNHSDKNKL